MQTDVCIIGCGPAGLVLSQLLKQVGISSIILERQTRKHVEGRIRAGVLEEGAAQTIIDIGMGERLAKNRLLHDGVVISMEGDQHHIDLKKHSGGRQISVYGQHESVRDMIAIRLAQGDEIVFEAGDVALHDVKSNAPTITYTKGGKTSTITCAYIAGCDGFHGVSRKTIPADKLTEYHRAFPFAWLGIMAEIAPSSKEVMYACHSRGFALHSMRSDTLSRLYLQVPLETSTDDWSDEKIWDELAIRLGSGDKWQLNRGPIIQKDIAPLRSFVVEPMQYGNLFLAGDAAHIVPPTGAKGMNLAIADVRVLADGLDRQLNRGDGQALERYSQVCLARIWNAQRFSWWMTSMLHRFPDQDDYQYRIARADLNHLLVSDSYQQMFAENYTGLPFAV